MKKITNSILLTVLATTGAFTVATMFTNANVYLEETNVDKNTRGSGGVIDPDTEEGYKYYSSLAHWDDINSVTNIAPEFEYLFEEGGHLSGGQAWSYYNSEETPLGKSISEDGERFSITFINFRKMYKEGNTNPNFQEGWFQSVDEYNAAVNDYYVVEPFRTGEVTWDGYQDLTPAEGDEIVGTGWNGDTMNSYAFHEIVSRQEIAHEFTGKLYTSENPAFEFTDISGTDKYYAGGYVDTIPNLEFGKEYYIATDWNHNYDLDGDGNPTNPWDFSEAYSEIFNINDGVDQGFSTKVHHDGNTVTGDSNLTGSQVTPELFTPIQFYKNNEVVDGAHGVTYEVTDESIHTNFDIRWEHHIQDVEEAFADDEWSTYEKIESIGADADDQMTIAFVPEGEILGGENTYYVNEGDALLTPSDDKKTINIDISLAIDDKATSEIEGPLLSNTNYQLIIQFNNNQWDPGLYGLEGNTVVKEINTTNNETLFIDNPVLEYASHNEAKVSILAKQPEGNAIDLTRATLYQNDEIVEQIDVEDEDGYRIKFDENGRVRISFVIDGLSPTQIYEGYRIELIDENDVTYEASIEPFMTADKDDTVIVNSLFRGWDKHGKAQIELQVQTPNSSDSFEFRAYDDTEICDVEATTEKIESKTSKEEDAYHTDKYLVTIESTGVYLDMQASVNGDEFKTLVLRDSEGNDVRVIPQVPQNDLPAWLTITITLLIVMILMAITIGLFAFFIVKYIDKKTNSIE